MTARPQDVALLPLPDSYMASEFVHNTAVYGANQMQAYARANVTAALASAQAREEELRAEVERWRGHYDDMSRRAVEAVNRREDAEARAERLDEALREIADWKLPPTGETWPTGGEVSYEALFGSNGARDYIRSVARAALSTNAATQTGETNEAAE